MKKTKRFTAILLAAVLLGGCGGKSTSPKETPTAVSQEAEIASEITKEETESENLYETSELITKTVGDIEYKVPEKWEDNSKTIDGSEYYYDEGLMIVIMNQEMDVETYDELFKQESEEDVRDALLSGMSGGFEDYKEISTKSEKVLGVTSFRYKADVVMNKTDYFMDVSAFAFKGKMYSFQMLVEKESGMDYSDEFESLLEGVCENSGINDDDGIKTEDEYLEKLNEFSVQLKELYKKDALEKLSYSEENSNGCFEVVIKSSKELSKRGSELESEEFVEDILFNPFCLSAGYLCNNYEEDTEYGKVGNKAFDLIGYIVVGDDKKRDGLLEEFDVIAKNHGMEIVTTDDSENETKEMEEESGKGEKEIIELSTGECIVGEDIPSGKYDIIGVSKGNIHVCSQGKDYGDVVNEIIVPGEIVYANVRLEDGYTVELVLGGKVQLQPK